MTASRCIAAAENEAVQTSVEAINDLIADRHKEIAMAEIFAQGDLLLERVADVAPSGND